MVERQETRSRASSLQVLDRLHRLRSFVTMSFHIHFWPPAVRLPPTGANLIQGDAWVADCPTSLYVTKKAKSALSEDGWNPFSLGHLTDSGMALLLPDGNSKIDPQTVDQEGLKHTHTHTHTQTQTHTTYYQHDQHVCSKRQALFEMPCHQELLGQESDTRSFFPHVRCYFPLFHKRRKLSKKLQSLLEAAATHSDCKRWRWIFCANSDFWQEELHASSFHNFTSTWDVNLSALAVLASITGFIVRCFHHGECNGAVATRSWSWQKNNPPPQNLVTLV